MDLLIRLMNFGRQWIILLVTSPWLFVFRICFNWYQSSLSDHNQLVDKLIENLNRESFALKLSESKFLVKKISWIGFDIDHLACKAKQS